MDQKNGNLDRKLQDMGGKSPQQKIKELQKKLKEVERKVLVWEAAMVIVKEEYGIDVKKFLNDSQREFLYRIEKN